MSLQVTDTLRKISAMKKRIRVICGSQGASKTFSILMLLINHCSSTPDRKVMVVSEELSKMKPTVIADFIKILKETGIYFDKNWNSSEAIYKFPNGSTITFKGMDKLSIGKGLRCDVLFANEANKIQWEAFREIMSRADQIFVDYNPNLLSFIDSELLTRDDCDFLRVTWRDNQALGAAEKEEILGYAKKAFNEDGTIRSEYWHNIWKVYSEGLTGSTLGAVYTNWSTGDFRETDLMCYALDFGYSSDPDALLQVAIDEKHKKIYIKEHMYENGQSEDVLALRLKQICGAQVIVADSAEDRLISDLKNKHKLNISAVSKPKVVESIKGLQDYDIIVDPKSTNAQFELQNYIWLDKSEKSIPIDKYNHLLDAMRYAKTYLTTPKVEKPVMHYRGNFRSHRYQA